MRLSFWNLWNAEINSISILPFALDLRLSEKGFSVHQKGLST